MPERLSDLKIVVRGAGEMATGTACRLYRSGFFRLLLTEVAQPLAVRRTVSFSEAVHEQTWTVEGIQAVRINAPIDAPRLWERRVVPVLVDPENTAARTLKPDVLVDAILAKRNLGTNAQDATLVIALGPGFYASRDVHCVVETNRGHDLGRLILEGEAEPNTGVPGEIDGHTTARIIRAPVDGIFHSETSIAANVDNGQVIGSIEGVQVTCPLAGILRGLIRPGTSVSEGLKIGDVDPRRNQAYCYTISDKARAIGGGVLEAILMNHQAAKMN